MHNFIYEVPTKIYFGENQLHYLKDEIKKLGKKVLITYGGGSVKKIGLYDKVVEYLTDDELKIFVFSGIEPNPKIESIREGADFCKKHGIDVILAIGGGSTIDAAKFISAGACVDFDPWDFFDKKAPIEKALPLISILTLAATGSEMNATGVISNMETNQKLGRSSNLLLPKVSFLDPSVTYSVSAYQTACGSADIMSHIMEVYFNHENGLYMLDCMMEGLLKTVIKYAPIALKSPDNYEARANLMWASTWAINSFIDGGKQHGWSCHTIEHQLSAYYDITHGLGLAIITPRWMKYCLDENNAYKFYQFGVNVFNINPNLPPMEVAEKSIAMLSDFFFNTLGLTSTLTEINIDDKHFKEMALKACKGSKINGFKTLEPQDVENIYNMCL